MLPHLDDYHSCAKEACVYAQAFISSSYYTNSKFAEFVECGPGSPHLRYWLLSIINFITDVTGIRILFGPLPVRGYGSWLCLSDGDDYAVVVDESQLNIWAQESGMPAKIQAIRSIVHELGHFILSQKLPARSGSTSDPGRIGVPIRSVRPIEEEKAWIFAFVFFAVINGHYARSSRELPRNRDDGCKVFV